MEIIEPEQEELAFVALKKDKEVETQKAIKKAIEVAQTKGGVMSRQAIITALGDFFEVPIRQELLHWGAYCTNERRKTAGSGTVRAIYNRNG